MMPEKTALIDILHAFSYGDNWYLVHPERFKSAPVSSTVGRNMATRQKDPSAAVSPETRKAIDTLGWKPPAKNQPSSRRVQRECPITSMDLFIAQQCSLACIYCYGGGGEYGRPGAMKAETAFQAVDWLWRQRNNAKTLNINFFGGEPLLQFDLLRRTVSFARSLEGSGKTRFQFSLATNATLVTDEIAGYLKENRFGINVGFDGPEAIHDRNRPLKDGASSWERVVTGFQKLMAVMPESVNLRATLWQKGEIHAVRKALASYGSCRYQTQPASPGGHCGENARVPSADWADTVAGIREAANDFVSAARKRDVATLESIKRWANFNWMLNGFDPPGRRPAMCPLGSGMAAVSATGDLYPCHRFVGWEDYRMGSVFENDMDREAYLRATYPEKEACTACWAIQACHGGCLFDHRVRTGHRFTPSDHHCRMIQSLLETAVYLKHALPQEERAFLQEERILVPRHCPVDLF